jgi:hypothetical protein
MARRNAEDQLPRDCLVYSDPSALFQLFQHFIAYLVHVACQQRILAKNQQLSWIPA